MTNHPIRVGFVVHVMQVAGAEVLVRETIRRLGGEIAPTIFCLDRLGSIGEELRRDGVDVVCLDRKPGWDWSVALRLAAEAKRRDIAVFHAHQYTPFFYAALAKVRMGLDVRLILTEHGRHYPDLVSPLRRALNRLVFDRLADDVNACIGFSARALSRIDGFAGNRIRVIENGIDVERYGPAEDRSTLRKELGWPAGRRVLIHVARHHPVKDQATLLRGFAQFAPHRPDVDLVLVGDGPLRGDLEELGRSLGISDRLRFLGIRSDIPVLLRAADAFALTSVSEAASLTLLEAMATGLPVVVSAVGGNTEIVRDGLDGYHFPRGNAAECAKAIGRVFADPANADRLGRSGRARTHERYRLDDTIDAYRSLYRRFWRR